MQYRGLAYPVKAGSKSLFESAVDERLIYGNIIQILTTRRGERVMLPEFGSRIYEFIHEPLDRVTCALIRRELIDAIARWEPRIILDKKNTNIIPYPQEYRVKAELRYFLKSQGSTSHDLILEINNEGGVTEWQD
ncbi:MAG: GPW/gp25 family protein [Synergistaceae bacterium]|nr:GPW/gp25 family protein [Synergistaceae bacterium]